MVSRAIAAPPRVPRGYSVGRVAAPPRGAAWKFRACPWWPPRGARLSTRPSGRRFVRAAVDPSASRPCSASVLASSKLPTTPGVVQLPTTPESSARAGHASRPPAFRLRSATASGRNHLDAGRTKSPGRSRWSRLTPKTRRRTLGVRRVAHRAAAAGATWAAAPLFVQHAHGSRGQPAAPESSLHSAVRDAEPSNSLRREWLDRRAPRRADRVAPPRHRELTDER